MATPSRQPLAPGKCHHCGDPCELNQRTGQPHTRCVAHRSYLRGRTTSKRGVTPPMQTKAEPFKRQAGGSWWTEPTTYGEFSERLQQELPRIIHNSRGFPLTRTADGIEASWA